MKPRIWCRVELRNVPQEDCDLTKEGWLHKRNLPAGTGEHYTFEREGPWKRPAAIPSTKVEE